MRPNLVYNFPFAAPTRFCVSGPGLEHCFIDVQISRSFVIQIASGYISPSLS